MSAPMLPYADMPARLGIAYQHEGDTVRVAVPIPKRWGYLLVAYVLPAMALGYVAGGVVAGLVGVCAYALTGNLPDDLVMEVIICTVMMLVVVAVAYRVLRSPRRAIIIASPHRLLIDAPGWMGTRRMSWPREQVLGVRAGPVPWNTMESVSMGLHLRIRGSEIVEVLPGHSREVAEWLAEKTRQGLGLPDPRQAGRAS
jgi:hypothetical protein